MRELDIDGDAAAPVKELAYVDDVAPNGRLKLKMGPMIIGSNSTFTIQVAPKCVFRPEKYKLTSPGLGLAVAGFFLGQRSMVATFQNAISLDLFAAMPVACPYTASAEEFITLQLMNLTPVQLYFEMEIEGSAVNPPSRYDVLEERVSVLERAILDVWKRFQT